MMSGSETASKAIVLKAEGIVLHMIELQSTLIEFPPNMVPALLVHAQQDRIKSSCKEKQP